MDEKNKRLLQGMKKDIATTVIAASVGSAIGAYLLFNCIFYMSEGKSIIGAIFLLFTMPLFVLVYKLIRIISRELDAFERECEMYSLIRTDYFKENQQLRSKVEKSNTDIASKDKQISKLTAERDLLLRQIMGE